MSRIPQTTKDSVKLHVNEIHHAVRAENPINEVSEPAADDPGNCPPLESGEGVNTNIVGKESDKDNSREDGEYKSTDTVRETPADAERDTKIAGVDYSQEIAEDLNGESREFNPLHVGDDEGFRDLIDSDDDHRQ